MRPGIGRIVVFAGIESNGSFEHPAMITRAWSRRDTRDGAIAVNLIVFLDNSSPVTRTSVMLFDNRELADAYRGANPRSPVCFWPDRDEQPAPGAPLAMAPPSLAEPSDAKAA